MVGSGRLEEFYRGKPDGEKLFIVSELATNGDVYEWLNHVKQVQNTGFPENLARNIFKQMLSGLEHCHSQGLAHRDLKLPNLLIDQNYDVKIADFGTAIPINENPEEFVGTRTYMPPETYSGAGQVYDAQAFDIYSCGIILFHLLTGDVPFLDSDVTKPDCYYLKVIGENKR